MAADNILLSVLSVKDIIEALFIGILYRETSSGRFLILIYCSYILKKWSRL
jgi:hypothetical protein